MRIGFLSDAHGNFLGLSACLQMLDELNVDQIFFLGDAVGYFPGVNEVLDILEAKRIICQLGNHDAILLGHLASAPENEKVYRHIPAREKLDSRRLARLASWPQQRTFRADGRNLLMVHGSPFDPLEGYCYPDSDYAAFAGLPYDAVFMGHTHRPFVARSGTLLIVNAGSCGMPRDQGNAPGFAVYDSSDNSARIFRVLFDPHEVLSAFQPELVAESVRTCLFRVPDRPVCGEFIRSKKTQ
jgi:putative phosphoesterase